jgi:putative ABC transport system permease protein
VRLADVAVRGNGGTAALAALVRAEVLALDPEQPISRVMSLDEALARGVAPRRFGLALLAGFALTALVLTLVGIYGVAAYSVGQRTPELGVRMALGADRGSIQRLVVRSVLAQVLAGVVVGVPLALLTTRALQGLLFEIGPTDPASFALVPLLLLAAGLAAALGPARRAARVDPVAALRWE